MFDDEELKRILAIDFGEKRIGLALSDPLMTFAYSFKTILNNEKFWAELRFIIKDKNIIKIILGLPLKENGEHSGITKKVIEFKEQLIKKFAIEVILQDERYTSQIAQQNILQSVTKKSKRRDKGLIDSNSAAIILQDYLNEIKK